MSAASEGSLVKVLAEAKLDKARGEAKVHLYRDAAGDYYTDYWERGRGAESKPMDFEDALADFCKAVRDSDKLSYAQACVAMATSEAEVPSSDL